MFGIVILLGTLSNVALGNFELKMLIHELIAVPFIRRITSQPKTTYYPMNHRKHNRYLDLLLVTVWLFIGYMPVINAMDINRIVAVVEDGVILESELNYQIYNITSKLAASGTQLPSADVIRQQVLERMIITKLQLQHAERAGMTVDDQTLQRSMTQLARQNNMSPEEFRNVLRSEGMNYSDFLDEMRNELIMNQLRNRLIHSRITVSDHEVQHFLETQGKAGLDQNIQFHLAHILIATPEAASPTQIQQARNRAEQVVAELGSGKDFKQSAISFSDGSQALNGGDLGWRRLSQVPTIFVDYVSSMQQGEIQGPIRSASGFHIIKMIELKGIEKHVVVQTNVRHILLKTSDLYSDEDARKKLVGLRERIVDGDDFSKLARSHSDDKGSALKGGGLGWTNPGAFVPQFEEAMAKLEPGHISQPVQTQFGWHLIQVLERAEHDNTSEYQKNQAREEIRKQKIEEETELWLRQLRNEAYVEIRLDKV